MPVDADKLARIDAELEQLSLPDERLQQLQAQWPSGAGELASVDVELGQLSEKEPSAPRGEQAAAWEAQPTDPPAGVPDAAGGGEESFEDESSIELDMDEVSIVDESSPNVAQSSESTQGGSAPEQAAAGEPESGAHAGASAQQDGEASAHPHARGESTVTLSADELFGDAEPDPEEQPFEMNVDSSGPEGASEDSSSPQEEQPTSPGGLAELLEGNAALGGGAGEGRSDPDQTQVTAHPEADEEPLQPEAESQADAAVGDEESYTDLESEFELFVDDDDIAAQSGEDPPASTSPSEQSSQAGADEWDEEETKGAKKKGFFKKFLG
jgi:hypothetical protein